MYDVPELMSECDDVILSKKNHKECLEIIAIAMKEAIRKCLPLKVILREYNKNDFITYFVFIFTLLLLNK